MPSALPSVRWVAAAAAIGATSQAFCPSSPPRPRQALQGSRALAAARLAASRPQVARSRGRAEADGGRAWRVVAASCATATAAVAMSRRRLPSFAAALAVLTTSTCGAFADDSDYRSVDINNATVKEYKQFPGMFPTAASIIAKGAPYKQVEDIYNIPNTPEVVLRLFKKYQPWFTCNTYDPSLKQEKRMLYRQAD
eukprot:CAMPEP_0170620978 /NCGR_PEP_ID=MMETSP0224-20130122/28354_1 /TAXON_ID=285029 /ORGANISM="Togula jolla, Strain CCCM 725" /LENGTH=195 /DNA_ID=CAMNT_0010947203 /DNA_START=49 /DNA_END=636 /DNA_ORIENTATION=-